MERQPVSGSGTPALLETKLHRPRVTWDMVQRPRLIEILNRGLDRPLTLVSAAAGFGKTTLVSNWLGSGMATATSLAMPSAWLSLDEGDSNLVTFLTYLIAAVRTAFPDACPETNALLRAPNIPPVQVFAISLLNEVDGLRHRPSMRSAGRFILVLDDLHLARSQAVDELLSEILAHPPNSMHLVLSSRRDPALPLAILRAQGRMTEIRSQDLRFTPTEAAMFLDRFTDIVLDNETLSFLDEQVEGWITGLRLAGLSLRRAKDPKALLAGAIAVRGHIADYLLDEVLAQQPLNVQSFLLKTSILDRLCGPLCDALLGPDQPAVDGQTMLERLDEGNLFVSPLDSERSWYRYHHLFQALLQQRLFAAVGAQGVADLHRAAYRWLDAQAYLEETIAHALAAGDEMVAADVVERHRHQSLNAENWYRLEGQLRLLSDHIVMQRPALVLTKAWVLLMHLELPTILRLLALVEQHLTSAESNLSLSERTALIGEVHAIHSMWDTWQNQDIEQVMEHGRRGLEALPESAVFARGIAVGHLATALQLAGETDSAASMLDRYIEEAPPSLPYSSSAWVSLIYIYFMAADLPAMRRWSDRLLVLGKKHDRPLSVGFAHYFCGVSSYEWNDLDAAIDHFSAVARLRYGVHYRAVHDALIGLAMAYQAKGMPEQARETVDLALAFFLEANIPSFLDETYSFQAKLALLQEDFDTALRWAASASPDATTTHMALECPVTVQSRILVACGPASRLEEAIRQVLDRLEAARATNNIRREVELLATLSLAHERQGRRADALRVLAQSVELGTLGSYTRTFVDFGADMAQLLRHLAREKDAPYAVERLLAALPEPAPGRPAVAAKQADPLTNREMDVLELLAERLSNKEIAARLVISPTTVKTYTRKIYGKLDAHSRREAVMAARTKGILPSH